MAVTHLAESRTLPLPVDDAFARVITWPLPEVFRRRYLALPPISEVREAPATWGTVGQTRRIVLADGGTMLETLTRVDPPTAFGYTLTEITGPLAPLATSIDGTWAFDAVGTGSRVTWSWDVHPRGLPGRLVMPVFGRLWHGFAKQGLAELETLLLA
jgi:hypothetical protein